ncbi:MAG: hypothetical protein K0S20_621 [Patescibacteria group bacterium]|jgi:Holliday junction resolvase-like predicted endonuclease|nr:hypothetical protein [Patescibacteria group bacterium]
MNSKEIGSYGESVAADFLITKGLKILGRNLVFKVGEIDLLCQDGETIVVVEVKTATNRRVFDPIFKIDYRKRKKLSLLALLVNARFPGRNIRIDSVTVSDGVVSHLENILE